MKALYRFLDRLISSLTRDLNSDRLRAEMEGHLAFQTEENIQAGMNSTEARRQAILKFGSPEALKEQYRSESGLPWIEALIYDARHALRRLRKAPAFTLTAVFTIALGMGATTSIFTLAYTVLLKSLAVVKPAELLRLGKSAECCYQDTYSQMPEVSLVSYQLYTYFRDHTKGFSELAAFSSGQTGYGVRRRGSPQPAFSDVGELISGNYFSMFGIHAAAGRLIQPFDDRPGASPVAVMSYRLWREKYNQDPSIVGATFDLSSKPFTIVGISPEAFYGDSLRSTPPDFYVSIAAGDIAPSASAEPGSAWLQLIGRMQPGANPQRIEAEMRVELKQWLRSHWIDMNANQRALFPRQTLYLAPGGAGITAMRDEYDKWLRILMMVSSFVLLIVCANVANLMLVRGLERRRQSAISVALGARPFVLVRHAFVESILLSIAGGALGLALAFAGSSLILYYIFPRVGEMAAVPISASPSVPAMLFTFVLSLVTGLVFGIAPAWMAARVDAIEALRGANRSTVRSGSLPRKLLVVAQAALCLVLLSASGMLTNCLNKLEHQDFGFEQSRRLVIFFDPRLAGYQLAQLGPLYARIQDAIRRVPGVARVALCIYSPLGGNNFGNEVWIEGHNTPGPNEDAESSWDRATAGYFSLIGNPILQGREIDERDTANSEHVAVINQAFARHFFGNQNPFGRYFGWANDSPTRYKIVGIAKDARYLSSDVDKPIKPFLFLPESQHDFDAKTKQERDYGSHYMRDIVVLSAPGSTISYERLRQALASVDPNLPITSIHPLSEQVDGIFRPAQLVARLASWFGFLSLVLSSLGLYGVAAYIAAQRFKEIGVRMALGAGHRHAVVLVLRGPFLLILTGLAVGFPLSVGAGQILGTEIPGLQSDDALNISVAILSLAACGFAASVIPAIRASFISPSEALRAD